jgi:hypothetical protein
MEPHNHARTGSVLRTVLILVAVGAGSLITTFLIAWQGKQSRSAALPDDGRPAPSTEGADRREFPPKTRARVRSNVPKLKADETPTVELVPRKPGYDPVALAPFVPPEQVFVGEVRNSAWADAVEPALLNYDKKAAAAVLPGFEVANVECRSTMCRLKWIAPKETVPMVSEVIRHLFPGALMKCKRNGEYYVGFVGGSGRYKRIVAGDPGATIDEMTRDRRDRAETIVLREGRGLHLPPEIVAAWPKGDAP